MSNPIALIVHSNPETCGEIARLVAEAGVNPDTAGSLSEATDQLDQDQYAFCLTDLQLGDGSGVQLVEHAQTHYPSLTTAVVTANGTMNAAVDALKAGAADFLALPVDADAMRFFVDALLKRAGEHGIPQHERRTRSMLLGNSALMRQIRGTITKLGQTSASVLISGESGTGKELAARLIHARSQRASGPFVAVNCGAIPHELMESEFFGHKRGSFTGATDDKQGLFHAAAGGTLFLDEVAELPSSMQVKLLRALQEKAVRPVGDSRERPVDVRVVSASHKNLEHLVEQRAFRQDLFYRINVIQLHMPALRERREDIPQLVEHTLRRLCQRMELGPPAISSEAMEALQEHPFAGNVRELENVIERALTLCESDVIRAVDLRLPASEHAIPEPDESNSLDNYLAELERVTILRALEATGWNKTKAARRLGISFRSLRYRLDKLGLNTA
jgi:two-component system response regulator PilR (NtrC family)